MDYYAMEAPHYYSHDCCHTMHSRGGFSWSIWPVRCAEWKPSGIEYHTSFRLGTFDLVYESARRHVSG
jgi:hypothetical protein